MEWGREISRTLRPTIENAHDEPILSSTNGATAIHDDSAAASNLGGWEKKLGLVLAGSALIALFLAWMLFKGTSAVQAWFEPNPWLGFVAWGLAWLCVLGGASLIARVIFGTEPNTVNEVD